VLSELIDVSGWTHEQWLTASILAFIIVTVLVVLHRLVKLFRMTRRQRYQPNLRPLRRRNFHHSKEKKQ
jgi:UDP-N-acetylmuramyl pentapeptide phosphotransferase/UDP-N-acetylglucosamine-1-phosphate transferase